MTIPVPLRLTRPGLFVTGTDTGVGKTRITAALARGLPGVGVCKPIATGCGERGGQLVSEDAVALHEASGRRWSMDLINPVRYVWPLAPGAAAEAGGEAGEPGEPVDWACIAAALGEMERRCSSLLVEGVGGVMVPLSREHTVLDLAVWLGLPVLIVARAGLGTINHTALTVAALRATGLTLVGIVLNATAPSDESNATNAAWVEHMTGLRVLASLPYDPQGTSDVTEKLAGVYRSTGLGPAVSSG